MNVTPEEGQVYQSGKYFYQSRKLAKY